MLKLKQSNNVVPFEYPSIRTTYVSPKITGKMIDKLAVLPDSMEIVLNDKQALVPGQPINADKDGIIEPGALILVISTCAKPLLVAVNAKKRSLAL